MLDSVKRFLRFCEASTAVEFAMLATPFLIMLVGIVELGLFFGTGVMLEGASTDAARMIRTGQAQQSGDPVTTFENELCQRVSMLVSCADLQYEVIPVPDNLFANVAGMTPTFDADGNLVSSGFDPGASEDVIMIRVVYHYTFLTPMLGSLMEATANTNQSMLMSTVVIKNEPYEFGT